mmetsp:Transcript_23179/g.39816  ORF Transcript_23179/g.39816 Transcript_23179/m.39816 type:complete len:209 (+) Transcript_23179:2010-2636(+)
MPGTTRRRRRTNSRTLTRRSCRKSDPPAPWSKPLHQALAAGACYRSSASRNPRTRSPLQVPVSNPPLGRPRSLLPRPKRTPRAACSASPSRRPPTPSWTRRWARSPTGSRKLSSPSRPSCPPPPPPAPPSSASRPVSRPRSLRRPRRSGRQRLRPRIRTPAPARTSWTPRDTRSRMTSSTRGRTSTLLRASTPAAERRTFPTRSSSRS